MDSINGLNQSTKKPDNTVPSPCIDICALNDNDICIGCYRHGNEISRWGSYTNDEKTAVLKKSQERMAAPTV